MSKPTYYELLRDPRWQKKRLEVMQRAEFSCENCGDSTTTINVHHKYYTKGAMPWDYPNEALACFCEPCHESWHSDLETVKYLISRAFPTHLAELVGYLKGKVLLFEAGPDSERLTVNCHGEACGLAEAYGIRGNDAGDKVIDVLDSGKKIGHRELWSIKINAAEPVNG